MIYMTPLYNIIKFIFANLMSDNLKSYIKAGGLALACAGFAAYFLLNKKDST